MKIAIDCRMIGSGGIGSYIGEILPHLLEKNGCLLIGTHEQCAPFVREQNAEFCFCDVPPFSVAEMKGLPKAASEKINQYEIFFTPYCNIPGKIEIPIVSTIHDVVFLDIPDLTNFLGRISRKKIYQRAIEKSEAIVTVSEFSKKRIKENLKCSKKIVITPNGVPSYLLKSDKIERESGFVYKDAVFVGNIKKHKGLSTLLDAFSIAKEKGFGGKLVIVGNFENFRTGDDETVKKLSKLKEDSDIVFTGRISNEKLKKIYEDALVLVQPSLYEGFGIPPLEAMSVGTPAIVSDIEVFKEIYSNLPVRFFSAGNASDLAEKLLQSEQTRLGEDVAQKIKEMYSYKKSAEILENTFKKILGVEE